METLVALPLSFWFAVLLVAGCGVWAVRQVAVGIGTPVLAILLTVVVWYWGDVMYNEYPRNHARTFTPDVLSLAWWQVGMFVITMTVAATVLHHYYNMAYDKHGSVLYRAARWGVFPRGFNQQVMLLWYATTVLWVILVIAAICKLKNESMHYFFPFHGLKRDPFGREQIGGGWSAWMSLAHYSTLLVGMLFGCILVLSRNPAVRWVVAGQCLLSWLPFLMDRTRKEMIGAVLPAVICYVLFYKRVRLVYRLVGLCLIVFAMNVWFLVVVSNRQGTTIDFANLDLSPVREKHARHHGLNMFEELCWIDTFLQNGTLDVAWGYDYYANLVNPIPRAIWPEKPVIALDYAEARGEMVADEGSAATISHGLIGQGVRNFGLFYGPVAAGVLMALWAVVLARMDLRGNLFGRFSLYMIGLVITFELGRDITMLSMYPFLFGLAAEWLAEGHARNGQAEKRHNSMARRYARGRRRRDHVGVR